MARTKGPLFSLNASGSLAKTLVYSEWKNRSYVREHVIPANPSSTTQVNVRTAWDMLVADWQAEAGAQQDKWTEYAKQFDMSGFNKFMGKGMDAYMTQLGSSSTPATVSVTGDPPADVWTWT